MSRNNLSALKTLLTVKSFFELSRLQMSEAVKYLASDMREADRRINRNFPMDQVANFFLFSLVEELRFDILDQGARKNELFQIARNNCNSLLLSKCDPLPYGEVFLGSAILGYYATFYLGEKSSSVEVEEHCIEAMTKYLDFKSNQISNRCCTCHA
ncbi:predicted protein [Chaetoceros tenuissimus]|uniref:Uncharacterized protein n=1 Tax=Chaetoceros tenuissimus TaxID=426638 RepID=A0AAD3DC28_9STRA|nr:predicted protein [Chaetoceros tenuissimus]